MTTAVTAVAPTLGDILTTQRRRGDAPLLICDAQRLSYAEADTRSAALAQRLVGLGVGKGVHVGVLFPNGPQFVTAALAAARIGAVVPFSTFSTPPELRRQLADSDVRVLLAARSFRGRDYVPDLTAAIGVPLTGADPLYSTDTPVLRHVLVDPDDTVASSDEPLWTALQDDVTGSDVLAVIYTSGSTSAPKGVVHTHASLLRHQRNLNAIRHFTEADRLFCNSPFFWIGGFAFALLATLVAGATLICSNATDAAETLDLIETEKPTVTNGFVAGIAHLARHHSIGGRALSARRGNLYPIMAPDVRPSDPQLRHNMLGMTEAGGVLLLSGDESDQPESRRGSYGFLAPEFEARIVGSEGGSVGELHVRGPLLMQGYYGRSREETFDADGWFPTGDVVRRDPDGVFYYLGRSGAMIKTAGANVAPAEVERPLTEALSIIDSSVAVHVVGLDDADRGQIVGAVIATDDGTTFDHDTVVAALRSEVSAYKVPRRVMAVRHRDIPVLSSGKVDPAALRRLFDE